MDAHTLHGGQVTPLKDGWRLTLPPGDTHTYRLAPLDDYHGLPRQDFPHHPPFWLQVRLRASHSVIPGTWGIGLWNDPFSLWIGGPAGRLRLPDLPNAAWFFFASPPNYLSFQDHLPAVGWLAATFSTPRWRSRLRFLAAPALPLAWLPGLRDAIRRITGKAILQDAVLLTTDATSWHTYALTWETHRVRFWVDSEIVLDTPCAPSPPLGLVLWVDNQYAAWKRGSAPRFGTLAANHPVWIEVCDLKFGQNLAKAPWLCYNSRRTGA